MPASITASAAMIHPSVLCACFTRSLRKAIVPLLTASTPVSAVQPLANDFRINQALTAAIVVCDTGAGTTGMGLPPVMIALATPIAIAISMQTRNRYVG